MEKKKYHIDELISEKKLNDRIMELAKQISEDYKGESLTLVGTLKGSVIFLGYLLAHINNDKLRIDFISTSSYGANTESSGNVHILKDLDNPIEGKNVLIVEDIIDTGNTLAYVEEMFRARNPKSIKICTLLDKPYRRVHNELKPDYCGFVIEDYFVVGFGLDYDEYYRNLPFVGKVIFEE